MQIWFSLRLTYHQFVLQIGLGHKGFLFSGSCRNYQNFKPR